MLVLAAPQLLRLLYGDRVRRRAPLVRTLSTVAALTSVVTLLTYAGLARPGPTLVAPWAGAAIEVALIQWRHGSASDVATGSVVALIPTLLVILLLEVRALARRPIRDRSYRAAERSMA